MRFENPSKDIGLILIGFTIYESVFGDWEPVLDFVGIAYQADEFTLVRAIIIFVFCVFISLSMMLFVADAIVENADMQDDKIAFFKDPIVKKTYAWINAFCVLACLLIATALMGGRQGFCLLLGFYFVSEFALVSLWRRL